MVFNAYSDKNRIRILILMCVVPISTINELPVFWINLDEKF